MMLSLRLRTGLLLTAVLASSLVMVGCPSDDVVVVDEYEEVSLEDIDETQLVFSSDSDSVPMEVGDIVVGSDGGGYLRRVMALDQDGDTVTTETEQVSLAEAVEVGVLDADVDFLPSDFQRAGMRMAGVDTTCIDLSGTVLYSKDGFSVTITNGIIDYAPHISVDASFADHKLAYLKAVSEGYLTVDMDVKVMATGAQSLSYEADIFPAVTKPFMFEIGPIPVVGTASLRFPVGIVGTVDGMCSVEAGFDSQTLVTIGGEYENGEWADLTNFGSFDPNGHEPVWAVAAGLGVDVYFKPTAGLNLYGASDLTGTLITYVAADAELLPPPMNFTVTAGIDGMIAYQLGIFDWNLVDESWYFPGPSWVLYQWTAPTE